MNAKNNAILLFASIAALFSPRAASISLRCSYTLFSADLRSYMCTATNVDDFGPAQATIHATTGKHEPKLSASDVTEIDISFSQTLTRIPRNIERHFANLDTLSVSGNKNLTAVGSEDFRPFRKLKFLLLHNNSIARIGDETFRFSRRLEILCLHDNGIEVIEAQAFSRLLRLVFLDLGDDDCRGRSFSTAEGRGEVARVVRRIENLECDAHLYRQRWIKQIAVIVGLVLLVMGPMVAFAVFESKIDGGKALRRKAYAESARKR